MKAKTEEVKRLRKAQAKAVMPLIGGLLDQWEQVPNDVKGAILEDAEGLADYLNQIDDAMETAGQSQGG